MIISPNYIRRFRQIAHNIDRARIDVYIAEATELDIVPRIGAELAQKYDALGDYVIDDLPEVTGDESDLHGLTPEEYTLLVGGYYDGGCGVEHTRGVRDALAYYAYARFVRNHPVQVTPLGVVTKTGDNSEPVQQQTIAAVASDARKIGDAIMGGAIEYWKTVTVGSCCKNGGGWRRKFVAVGD